MNMLTLFLTRFIQFNQRIQTWIGHTIAWGTLSLVLITAAVVILRYGFDSGSIALQESIMYNHAIVFMLGIAYTYLKDEHVRVDLFYGRYSQRQKHWVDLLGSLLFTLPVMIYILWISFDYISASWAIQEGSAEAGGLGYVYLLKTLIALMAILVSIQALAIMANAFLSIQGRPDQAEHAQSQGGKL